jgi:hypothetical protein
MTFMARLQSADQSDRRVSSRRRLCLPSNLEATGDEVAIHDLSCTGMLIETAAKLAPFDGLELDLPEAGPTQAVIVWNSGRYFGCEFTEPVSKAAVSAALLRSAPSGPAVPPTLQPAPGAPSTSRGVDDQGIDEAEDDSSFEEKAPLTVRLRVILGSAVLLWALIIWGGISLIRLIRGD